MENEIEILIVEDEALIAQMIKMQLEDFGYSVSGVCYNYASALQAIQEKSFDVLITDINLGDSPELKSGIQIAAKVKEIKSCPIIFLTAFSDKDTIKNAAKVLPSAYLVKPVNASSLFAALQLAVENFASQKVPTTEKTETTDYFFIKQNSKTIKTIWKDVYHLEAVKNYVKIKTKEYNSGLLLRGSLQDVLQNRMPPVIREGFVKVNRAEAVNKNCITEIGKGIVVTDFGTFKTSADFKLDDFK